jgi:hypothetical protein
MPMLTIKAKVHADPRTESILKDAMLCATKVYNGLLFSCGIFEKSTRRRGSLRSLGRI